MMPSCNTYRLTWVSLTLDEGYLLTAALSYLQLGIAPLGPPVPSQPPLLGCGVGGCDRRTKAQAAATGTLSAAERSYPMSKVRGRSQEDPMPERKRPRGVTPRWRSGRAVVRRYPSSKVRSNGCALLEQL